MQKVCMVHSGNIRKKLVVRSFFGGEDPVRSNRDGDVSAACSFQDTCLSLSILKLHVLYMCNGLNLCILFLMGLCKIVYQFCL
ncbi:hypothetical protein AALP_AA7G115200 [Arabis alpina]|uniref:Uncharacterized protein n=1 Tax=Arabis alpina TaxID=50452 RepID=A0A087GHE7_ARAAL|nr:hypothetical protein AALP_AA7G115200 [Arabis alpina]